MQNNDLAVFSDWDEALNAAIVALGGHKKVGSLLRPELGAKPDLAGQWLRDCLNAERRERLNPGQMILLLKLAKEDGYHATKHWLDAELGYEQGRPLEPRDESEKLLREFVETGRHMQKLAERIERLTQAPLKAVG